MTRYEKLKHDLETTGVGEMTCAGPSMLPILPTKSHLHFVKEDFYEKGDIVFCKVRGRYIDAHLITKVAADGRYMISNNHGHDNGWTRTIYGRCVKSDDGHNIKTFPRKVST